MMAGGQQESGRSHAGGSQVVSWNWVELGGQQEFGRAHAGGSREVNE